MQTQEQPHFHDTCSVAHPLGALTVFSSIYDIPGVNNDKGALLEKLCGGSRIMDLLLYFPHNYVDRSSGLSEDKVGSVVTFAARVKSHSPPRRKRSGRIPYRAVLSTEIGEICIIFFNYSRGHLNSIFKVGHECVISGKLEMNKGKLQITHPDLMTSDVSRLQEIRTFSPVYSTIKGLSSPVVHKIIKSVLPLLPDLNEWIRPDLLKQKSWYSWKKSVEGIHIPESTGKVRLCKARLAYDELLSYHVAMHFSKQDYEKGRAIRNEGTYRKIVLEKLGFGLTEGQASAINSIVEGQASEKQMIKLLQGDVGSGKTVVALFAMLNVVESGGQAALMVPTEVLAEQHCNWVKKVTEDLNIRIELLTGHTRKKAEIRKCLLSGEIDIIIGTHALFQEQVKFCNLRLVVIDEQQRFGVLQRMRLIEKDRSADVLLVTATPIPRTLEQVLYGNIDRITLLDKPECRLPVKTSIVKMDRINEVCSGLKRALDDNHKIYWICPHIESCEMSVTTAVEDRFLFLKKMFGDIVGVAHGALTQESRDRAIGAFYSGDIKVLVATTVVEVGVDVPDATIIIIENPERFGLSQLHQLRGRVGRGSRQSFCILLHGQISKIAQKKLNILRSSHDSFYIAEQDLVLRGGGDMLGCRQSGIAEFRFANPFDVVTVSDAHKDASDMVQTAEGMAVAHELTEVFGYSTPHITKA